MEAIEKKKRIIESIREINKLIHRKHHDLAQRHNLTHDQFHLLVHLDYRSEQPTIGELATRTNKAQNTISEKVARLEEKGLVERKKDEKDRRVSRVVMTEAGRDLINSISYQARYEFVLKALEKMEQDTVETLFNGLDVLTEKLNEQ